MTGITEVTRYVTDDGVEHKTLAEAQAHGDVRNLADFIQRAVGTIYDQQAERLAKALLEAYTMEPR